MSIIEKSLVVCYTGGRGSGKTLSMTVQASIDMIQGRRCWSNYPISFKMKGSDSKIVSYDAEPLEFDRLYDFDQSFQHGLVLIDEINLWADSRRSMNVSNRLLTYIFQLIRKRRLSFYLTVQNFDWLDKRIRWQTDVLIKCFDLSFAYHELTPGEAISQTLIDLSGAMTGHPAGERDEHNYWHRPDVRRTMHAKDFFKVYDTFAEFDVRTLATQRLRFHSTTKMIGDGEDSMPAESPLLHGDSLDSMIVSLRDSGVRSIPSKELQTILNREGIKASKQNIGRRLKALGLVYHRGRSGDTYDFPENII